MAVKTIETRAVVSAQDKTGATFSQVAQRIRGIESTAAAASKRMDALARGMSAVGAARMRHEDIARRMTTIAPPATVAAVRAQGLGARVAAARAGIADFASGALPAGAGVALGMGAAAGAGLAVGGVAAYGMHQAISFEKAMADVKKKVTLDEGATYDDVEKLINKTARQVGMTREEIAQLAATAGQAGIAYKDLGGFITLAAKAASAWDMPAKDAAQNLASIKAQTQWTIKELETFSDKVNALGDSSASAEKNIIDMFNRSAGAAKAAGVPLDTALAITTGLNSAGMQQEVASRFTNTFTSRLRTATEQSKDAAKGFAALGFTPKQIEAGMKKDATGTLMGFLERLEKSPNKASISTKIFGREWWDEASRAGQSLPEITKNLRLLSGGAAEGSLTKNLATDLETTSSHLKRFGVLTSEVGDRLTRWALPSINDQLEKTIKSFDVAKDSGFLAGPDGKPIDRLADKTPVPFGTANRRLFLSQGAPVPFNEVNRKGLIYGDASAAPAFDVGPISGGEAQARADLMTMGPAAPRSALGSFGLGKRWSRGAPGAGVLSGAAAFGFGRAGVGEAKEALSSTPVALAGVTAAIKSLQAQPVRLEGAASVDVRIKVEADSGTVVREVTRNLEAAGALRVENATGVTMAR